jgi:hypothetical protein
MGQPAGDRHDDSVVDVADSAERVPADRAVVCRVVAHLRSRGHPGIKVDRWLEKEYPGQSVVEAIAGPFAIEHTSVDTLPDQRRVG